MLDHITWVGYIKQSWCALKRCLNPRWVCCDKRVTLFQVSYDHRIKRICLIDTSGQASVERPILILAWAIISPYNYITTVSVTVNCCNISTCDVLSISTTNALMPDNSNRRLFPKGCKSLMTDNYSSSKCASFYARHARQKHNFLHIRQNNSTFILLLSGCIWLIKFTCSFCVINMLLPFSASLTGLSVFARQM